MKTNTDINTWLWHVEALRPQWQTLSPFLFCVHHLDHYPKGNGNFGPNANLAGRQMGMDFDNIDNFNMYHGSKVPGFPAHPHRGFETVTIVKQGYVDHADSHGDSGRYGMGDVQWMSAGSGLNHSEMFPLFDEEKPNTLELFQIWLNLPRKDKFTQPTFKMLWDKSIPKVVLPNNSGNATVYAGTYLGSNAPKPLDSSWAFHEEHHVSIIDFDIKIGGTALIPASVAGVNRALFVYSDSPFQLNGERLPPKHRIVINPEVELNLKGSEGEVKVLLLQGMPIDEPVVQHGPFVMTTQDEIQQTFEDYQRTRFGGWPWPTNEPVHGPFKGKFSNINGVLEEQ